MKIPLDNFHKGLYAYICRHKRDMLVEAPRELRSPYERLMPEIVGAIPRSKVFELSGKSETEIALPHVSIKINPNQKLEGPMRLYPDREPILLPVDDKAEELNLPTGATVWMKIDGHQYLISDHTTEGEGGVRGVSISHGGLLQHEVKYRSYWQNGREVRVASYLYFMPTYSAFSTDKLNLPRSGNMNLREGDKGEIAGVTISYDSDPREIKQVAENILYEKAA